MSRGESLLHLCCLKLTASLSLRHLQPQPLGTPSPPIQISMPAAGDVLLQSHTSPSTTSNIKLCGRLHDAGSSTTTYRTIASLRTELSSGHTMALKFEMIDQPAADAGAGAEKEMKGSNKRNRNGNRITWL